MLTRAAISFLLTACALAVPSTADACVCIVNPPIYPSEGDVPPNVRFHGFDVPEGPVMLVRSDGEVIPMQRQPVGPRVTRLTPAAALREGWRYATRGSGAWATGRRGDVRYCSPYRRSLS